MQGNNKSCNKVCKKHNNYRRKVKRNLSTDVSTFKNRINEFNRIYEEKEENLRELREYLSTLSINVGYVPTVPELESIIKNETVLYIKNEYGEFVPVWKQPEW